MGDSGYRGVSADQDSRFGNKDRKLIRQLEASKAFPPSFNTKVDLRKVSLTVIKPWIEGKVSELLGFEDDVVVEYIMGILESDENNPHPDPRKMQVSLTGFLESSTPAFMSQLWDILLSAQKSIGGIPAEFVERKKEELRAAREKDQAAIRASGIAKTLAAAGAAGGTPSFGTGANSAALPVPPQSKRGSRWDAAPSQPPASSALPLPLPPPADLPPRPAFQATSHAARYPPSSSNARRGAADDDRYSYSRHPYQQPTRRRGDSRSPDRYGGQRRGYYRDDRDDDRRDGSGGSRYRDADGDARRHRDRAVDARRYGSSSRRSDDDERYYRRPRYNRDVDSQSRRARRRETPSRSPSPSRSRSPPPSRRRSIPAKDDRSPRYSRTRSMSRSRSPSRSPCRPRSRSISRSPSRSRSPPATRRARPRPRSASCSPSRSRSISRTPPSSCSRSRSPSQGGSDR